MGDIKEGWKEGEGRQWILRSGQDVYRGMPSEVGSWKADIFKVTVLSTFLNSSS